MKLFDIILPYEKIDFIPYVVLHISLLIMVKLLTFHNSIPDFTFDILCFSTRIFLQSTAIISPAPSFKTLLFSLSRYIRGFPLMSFPSILFLEEFHTSIPSFKKELFKIMFPCELRRSTPISLFMKMFLHMHV